MRLRFTAAHVLYQPSTNPLPAFAPESQAARRRPAEAVKPGLALYEPWTSSAFRAQDSAGQQKVAGLALVEGSTNAKPVLYQG